MNSLAQRPAGRPIVLFLVVTVAAAFLSGCRGHGRLSDQMALMLDDPAQRHAITFDRRRDALIIEVPRGSGRLGDDQLSEVHRYMRRYRDESDGRLMVWLPRSAGGHYATRQALHQVNDIMLDNGIDPETTIVRRYHGDRRSWPEIRLAYLRPVAVAPDCGDWSEDVSVNRERIHYPDYGCATQRNLAASVDNGRDLIGPRKTAPRSSERRSALWQKYVGAKSSGASGKTAKKSPGSTGGK